MGTSNMASNNPVMYIYSSSESSTVTTGSFIQGVNCHAIGEVFFNCISLHTINYFNSINNSCQLENNGVFRIWGSETTLSNGIFLDNKGNLFIAVTSDAVLTLTHCYVPNDFIAIGEGTVINQEQTINSNTNNIHFDECRFIFSSCLTYKSNSFDIIPFLPEFMIFLIRKL